MWAPSPFHFHHKNRDVVLLKMVVTVVSSSTEFSKLWGYQIRKGGILKPFVFYFSSRISCRCRIRRDLIAIRKVKNYSFRWSKRQNDTSLSLSPPLLANFSYGKSFFSWLIFLKEKNVGRLLWKFLEKHYVPKGIKSHCHPFLWNLIP